VSAFVLALCTMLTSSCPERFAEAVATVVREAPPLYRDDESRERTAALVVAVAWYESAFRLDAVGDQGRSVCAMQIYHGSRSLLTDPEGCIRAGLRKLRASIAACPDAPLAVYARGKCRSAEGKRISAHRMQLANRLYRESRP
jgi:hypothetical protein